MEEDELEEDEFIAELQKGIAIEMPKQEFHQALCPKCGTTLGIVVDVAQIPDGTYKILNGVWTKLR